MSRDGLAIENANGLAASGGRRTAQYEADQGNTGVFQTVRGRLFPRRSDDGLADTGHVTGESGGDSVSLGGLTPLQRSQSDDMDRSGRPGHLLHRDTEKRGYRGRLSGISSPADFNSPFSSDGRGGAGIQRGRGGTVRQHRRYGVGDRVLVGNHQSRWANLVNRYGFPQDEGKTTEEQNGPYVYVLAEVRRVHFEENAQYYTVRRFDTGADQRADAEWMEPIRPGSRGEAAALRAATVASPPFGHPGGLKNQKLNDFFGLHEGLPKKQSKLSMFTDAATTVVSFFDRTVGVCMRKCYWWLCGFYRAQALLFLNGLKPYSCSVRVTGVNLLVLCSTWYMFIDQMRISFFPPQSDFAVSVVSCVVWFILVLELVFEVFIRPDGYNALLQSEKAYAPATVRHINRFHAFVEALSLACFVPDFLCLFTPGDSGCSGKMKFSFTNACLMSVLGPDQTHAFYGRAFFALLKLRIFGMVRHWKQMWIMNTIVDPGWSKHQNEIISGVIIPHSRHVRKQISAQGTSEKGNNSSREKEGNSSKLKVSKAEEAKKKAAEHDMYLVNATNIGTALMVINSQRALVIFAAIVSLLPILAGLGVNGNTNIVSTTMVEQLQATNLFANSDNSTSCEFLQQSVHTWIEATNGGRKVDSEESVHLLSLRVLPARCDFQGFDGWVTSQMCHDCPKEEEEEMQGNTNSCKDEKLRITCKIWNGTDSDTTNVELARRAHVRPGVVEPLERQGEGVLSKKNSTNETQFLVSAVFNQQHAAKLAAMSTFILQIVLLLFVLFFLSLLRLDAQHLVLGPLRRMLKIVALYAKNPLAPSPKRDGTGPEGDGSDSDGTNDSESDSDLAKSPEDQLGNYETEQLINAVEKITVLLRQCWGVAGAGIISSNLARQEDGLTAVFNPTVPGKAVYALFAFAAIKGFDHQLRVLGGEVMSLINDVARVLHKEVFRWGFGDSGQCNKNLGGAFLMVFRIGDVKEVKEKMDTATDVIFSSALKKNAKKSSSVGIRRRKYAASNRVGSDLSATDADYGVVRLRKKMGASHKAAHDALSLASLPGINKFTDLAVVGMLKAYAGIYRDQKLLTWKDDFRLGAGVGAFSVDMMFGMDAGWAVEGAVGSEYKIDATYLSPHVNMASRMMSATKQYGVTILLSQAVQELLSEPARALLRHLDTVTVKGSSVKQRIYTYDCRHKGVNFFLFERSDAQADMDAERYTPNLWNTDQDLTEMRQHVTDEFIEEFNRGRREYLQGNWSVALKHLKAADNIMVDTVMEQGYVEEELNEIRARILNNEDVEAEEAQIRNEMGDGPSRRLMGFIESKGGIPPSNWKGYRPLTSK